MKREILTRPFEPHQIKTRTGSHGKTISYIETHSVIARLNEGCDAWSFEIVSHEFREQEVVVVGKLIADGVTKMAFGASAVTRDRDGRAVSLGDDAKAAASDSLKKAASLLGVALELYGAGADGPSSAQGAPAKAARPLAAPARPRTVEHTPVDLPDVSERLTTKQFTAVQSIARRKSVSPMKLAHMLGERFKKSELGQLTRREASSLIAELTEANGKGP